MTFAQWMQLVETYVQRMAGVSVGDLPDCCFRDWYDDNESAKQAAARAIRAAKE